MKRRIDSSELMGSDLKRRSSSLFSIATIAEEAKDVIGGGSKDDDTIRHAVSVSSSTAPTVAETDSDFFIDDEEEDDLATTTKTPFLSYGMRQIQEPDSVPIIEAEMDLKKVLTPKDLRTGILFEAGSKHFDRHNRYHKERPIRVTAIQEALTSSDANFAERCTLFQQDPNTEGREKDFLDDEDFLKAHLPGYIKRLGQLSECNCCDRLDREAEQYKSIYLTPDSVSQAKAATASLCKLVTQVVEGDLDNGFAVIRPPGHHAEPGVAGGYCIINNVAVAAAYARQKLGLERVLIVDWDVHHGNGTQSIFLKDPNVLYFSVHRWHGGNFYPFLQNGGPTNIGFGEGAGYNVNVGWSKKGMGDEEYLAVWERVLMPIAQEYNPDLVLVSAGFDAADGDMGECHVTPECFGRLTRSLMTLAKGKIVCALEGGYVRSVLATCVVEVARNLLVANSAETSESERRLDQEERGDADILDTIDPTAAKNIRSTIAALKSYWTCFQ